MTFAETFKELNKNSKNRFIVPIGNSNVLLGEEAVMFLRQLYSNIEIKEGNTFTVTEGYKEHTLDAPSLRKLQARVEEIAQSLISPSITDPDIIESIDESTFTITVKGSVTAEELLGAWEDKYGMETSASIYANNEGELGSLKEGENDIEEGDFVVFTAANEINKQTFQVVVAS
jgi:hypothetical protein